MTQLRNGSTTNNLWIELSLARFTEPRIPWAFRMKELDREIEMRETDLDLMVHATPDDDEAHAHSEAHLEALRKVRDELGAGKAFHSSLQ